MAEFNETFHLPRICMATVFPGPDIGPLNPEVKICGRRGGAGSGGVLRAVLEVSNTDGYFLHLCSKIAQLEFDEIGSSCEASAESSSGCDDRGS